MQIGQIKSEFIGMVSQTVCMLQVVNECVTTAANAERFLGSAAAAAAAAVRDSRLSRRRRPPSFLLHQGVQFLLQTRIQIYISALAQVQTSVEKEQEYSKVNFTLSKFSYFYFNSIVIGKAFIYGSGVWRACVLRAHDATTATNVEVE